MHRIKNLLLLYPNCRSFYELPALFRGYGTSSAARGQQDSIWGRHFGTQAAAEPFMNGSSSSYIEDMFESWQRDPNSVHKVIFTQNPLPAMIFMSFFFFSTDITASLKLCCSDFYFTLYSLYFSLFHYHFFYSSNAFLS